MDENTPLDELESIRTEIFYFMTRYPAENDTRSYKLLGKFKEHITEYLHQYEDCNKHLDYEMALSLVPRPIITHTYENGRSEVTNGGPVLTLTQTKT